MFGKKKVDTMNNKAQVIGNINPMIYEKTKDGEAWYDVFSRLIKERILFISEEIDAEVATAICATLLYLNNQNKTKDINLHINTPGGTVQNGLFTIYDTIQYIEAPVRTVCIGEACSAGAILLVAGTTGKRSAYENSTIMLHQINGGMEGSMPEINKMVKHYNAINKRSLKILADHTGKPISKLEKDMREDKYFTAKEALEYGLIDSIIERKKKLPDFSNIIKNVKKSK
jgi:ATP-dependent Clp protease protease subunit